MYVLRVSQKVLFICNLCWLAGVIFRLIPLTHWPDFLIKNILVMGWVVALPLGVLWFGAVLILLYGGKLVLTDLHKWLFILNSLFIPAILIYRLI